MLKQFKWLGALELPALEFWCLVVLELGDDGGANRFLDHDSLLRVLQFLGGALVSERNH